MRNEIVITLYNLPECPGVTIEVLHGVASTVGPSLAVTEVTHVSIMPVVVVIINPKTFPLVFFFMIQLTLGADLLSM